MPCGGIWPVDPGFQDGLRWECWVCRSKEADHYCEEWDCGLCGKCIAAFLETDEGQVVINHGHEVRRYTEVLHGGT